MLRKFREMLSASSGADLQAPPFAIRASDLDHNFRLCYPRPTEGNNAPYRIEWGAAEGWRLRGERVFEICENGKPVKYRFFAEKEFQDV